MEKIEGKEIICDQADYDARFDEKIRKETLEVALDTRKFEIDLYWKRATYFWAFIAASFTAYFLIITSKNIDEIRGFTIVVSTVGYFFSLGWYFVNRGSKYWQENWEDHVSFLEQNKVGPIFKFKKAPKDKFRNLTKGYTFSVSKVNQLLSLGMTFFWLGLIIYSTVCYYNLSLFQDLSDRLSFSSEVNGYIILGSILVVTIIFKILSHSFLKKDDYKKIRIKEKHKFIS